MAAAWLGNVLTQGEIGGLARFGYNMPDDFGPTLMRGMGYMPPPRRSEGPESGSDWGFAIHGGAFANLILRDITLDGNTLGDSRSVDKNPFVPAAAVGFAFGNRRFLASFSYVFWGQQFEGQRGHSEFGSAACSYFF